MLEGSADEAADLPTRARCREMLLIKSFYLLTDSWSQPERDQCMLNRQLLRMVSESYFKDLERKKEFHDITYADAHKRAGYMAKWIMRFRPVQLTSENAGVRALLVNEHFSLTVAFKFLQLPPSSLPPALYKNLVYSLRFRLVDANAWALSFFLMEAAYGRVVSHTR
jgi:hypothetical protein